MIRVGDADAVLLLQHQSGVRPVCTKQDKDSEAEGNGVDRAIAASGNHALLPA